MTNKDFTAFTSFPRTLSSQTTAENTTEPLTNRMLEPTPDTNEENETFSEDDLDDSCESVGQSRRSLSLIAKAIQKSGLQLLEKLEPTEKEPNVIISPLSISLALSQLALGKQSTFTSN